MEFGSMDMIRSLSSIVFSLVSVLRVFPAFPLPHRQRFSQPLPRGRPAGLQSGQRFLRVNQRRRGNVLVLLGAAADVRDGKTLEG